MRETKALCTVFYVWKSDLHRGNHFEPIKRITRILLFLPLECISLDFVMEFRMGATGRMLWAHWMSPPESLIYFHFDVHRHGSSGSLSQTKVLKTKPSLASRFKEHFLKIGISSANHVWGWLSFYPVRIRQSKMSKGHKRCRRGRDGASEGLCKG